MSSEEKNEPSKSIPQQKAKSGSTKPVTEKDIFDNDDYEKF